MVSICFLNHTADCRISSRKQKNIPDVRKHLLVLTLFCDIIGALGSLLNVNGYNLLSILVQCLIVQEHG